MLYYNYNKEPLNVVPYVNCTCYQSTTLLLNAHRRENLCDHLLHQVLPPEDAVTKQIRLNKFESPGVLS